MLDDIYPIHKWRVLLTETLPYEVPLIFSNEQMFRSLVATNTSEQITQIIEQLRPQRTEPTIPYSYQIRKDEGRQTTLSVVHPLQQMNIAEFYATYAETLIDFCGRGSASIRFPVSINTLTTRASLEAEATLKTGVPAVEPAPDELEASRISSYFTYRKYTLLSKFLDSSEFRTLEKEFKFLRTLDISKCFFNMYTHSITWAIKGKGFSKKNADQYSFEGSFDKLMQRCNYNETNGIVVGPEISRIFAEIILQRVDLELDKSLAHRNLSGKYVVKRYVDDYFIFCNSSLDADNISLVLASHLEDYKLFLNSQKTGNYARPFISTLSLARSELGKLIAGIRATLDTISAEGDSRSISRKAQELRFQIFDLRNIIGKYNVSISSISAWYLSNLRICLQKIVKLMVDSLNQDLQRSYFQICEVIIEGVFYICALDFRVRSTYTLCQILVVLLLNSRVSGIEYFDIIRHRIQMELEALLADKLGSDDDELNGNVELFNVLIAGAHCLGHGFVITEKFKYVADRLLEIEEISYFNYTSLKFCLIKDKSVHAERLRKLNDNVKKRIMLSKDDILDRSELYLLLCDFISAPDLSGEEKLAVYKYVFGGNKSKALIEAVGSLIAFSDWSGVNIQHLLARKELRPAYD